MVGVVTSIVEVEGKAGKGYSGLEEDGVLSPSHGEYPISLQ